MAKFREKNKGVRKPGWFLFCFVSWIYLAKNPESFQFQGPLNTGFIGQDIFPVPRSDFLLS